MSRCSISRSSSGLPDRCNREWFAQTFCEGASLADPDTEPVWPKIAFINVYNPLALLAALPVVEAKFLAETAISLRSATHKVMGMSDRQPPLTPL